MIRQVQIVRPRRAKMNLGSLGINVIHNSRPWVAAWWSCALPGFGHIYLGMYTKGFLLMSGEIGFNVLGHINLAIYYTFWGQFQRANQVLNYDWSTLYCAIFVFSIWDSYRVAIEINKLSWLESKQEVREFRQNSVKEIDSNSLDKRVPWLGGLWSVMFTGLGHIYCHKIVSGFILLGWTVVVSYQSKLPHILMYSLTGQFNHIPELNINYQWFLFFPSIYFFGIYDAYEQTVTANQLFKEEQIYYLQNKYGNHPIRFLTKDPSLRAASNRMK